MTEPVEILADVLRGMTQQHEYEHQWDWIPIGAQVPMFVGACLYCDHPNTPNVWPYTCPTCGAVFSEVVLLAWPRPFWRAWHRTTRRLWKLTPRVVREMVYVVRVLSALSRRYKSSLYQ